MEKTTKKLKPARVVVLGFMALIALGTLLLMLPVSVRDGVAPPSLITALFTATSATCITGLTITDTAATFSLFGQIVILFLFQIGGLGFMTATTLFFFIMNKKINLSQRLLIMQSFSLNDIQGVVRLIRHVLIGTFIIEGAGALILWQRFFPAYGFWRGLGLGVFHSVSAFCNAGFSLLGPDGLLAYANDAFLSITLMLLVVLGGLGFFVWEDVWKNRRFKSLHLHSKMVLSVTAILIVSGFLFIFIAERLGGATLSGMTLPQALLMSLFQAITPRSAGFSMINQAQLSHASIMMVMLLMLIGGSAGSTGGGIKNVTAAILFLSAIRSLRGKRGLSVFGRNVPEAQIISALSILILVLGICFGGATAIMLVQPELPFMAVLFEMVSAVATCGLSMGITGSLSATSLLIMIPAMFLGRVGVMTFGMAAFIRRSGGAEKTKRPDVWVMT